MSAWIVTNGHIDVLVHALAQYGVVAPNLGVEGFRKLGQQLWQENHASVNYRYSENTGTPRYQLHTTEATLDPVVVLKAAACFDYQSCEHPGWIDSEAHSLMKALRTAIFDQCPELGEWVNGSFGWTYRYTLLPAYENAPWGIDTLEEVVSASEVAKG